MRIFGEPEIMLHARLDLVSLYEKGCTQSTFLFLLDFLNEYEEGVYQNIQLQFPGGYCRMYNVYSWYCVADMIGAVLRDWPE